MKIKSIGRKEGVFRYISNFIRVLVYQQQRRENAGCAAIQFPATTFYFFTELQSPHFYL